MHDATIFRTTGSQKTPILISDTGLASRVAAMLMISDPAFAGSVSGIAARLITVPLDVIKIRFQLQLEPIKSSVNGIKIVCLCCVSDS